MAALPVRRFVKNHQEPGILAVQYAKLQVCSNGRPDEASSCEDTFHFVKAKVEIVLSVMVGPSLIAEK